MYLSGSSPLRIGTRGSILALVQARTVLEQLQALFPDDPAIQEAKLVIIKTTGDRITNRPLNEIGGKGLFAKELEQALVAGEIDCAVHSLKDMETQLPAGLKLAAMLKREDARDALISPNADSLQTLPQGSSVGTCAPRRVAQIKHLRPDLTCISVRGNVDSRMRKLHEGYETEGQKVVLDAIILAVAGLKRLGRQDEITCIIPETEMLPAAGQGVITVECRENDRQMLAYLKPLNHWETEQCVLAERFLVRELNGSCRTPIGAHAVMLQNGHLKLEALTASFTGSPLYRIVQAGSVPHFLAQSVAAMLKQQFEPGFWEEVCVF